MSAVKRIFNNDWDIVLKDTIAQPFFDKLMLDVAKEYESFTCYPPKDQIFNAFSLTDYRNTLVLIIGQDPYHNPLQAMGLAFSVNKGVKLPPSLENIYKELRDDLGVNRLDDGDLTDWANSGVLLLNAILTVRENQPLSHANIGWQEFTDRVIEVLNNKIDPMIFVLWGSFAKSKKKLITNSKHFIIENVHPSPLSAYRGFFGSKPFSKINAFLSLTGRKKINF